MNQEPITLLSIDGKRITSFTSVKLDQKINDHHQFEIIVDNDVIEVTGGHTIDKSKDWLGKSLIITFGDTEFLGYITSIHLENKDGHNGNLILNGYSPTILLEGGKYMYSWVNNTLEAIVNQTLETLNIGTKITPVFKEAIEYQAQYKENNYQFLQRLAKQYNEWFYYNGIQIIFGKPEYGKVVRLEYGRDISELRLEIKVNDHSQTSYSYNASNNSLVASTSKNQVEGLNELSSHAFYASSEIYKTKKNGFTGIDTKMKSQIDDFVERKQATASAGLHIMKGRSTKQGLTVGSIIKVESAKVASAENNGKSTFDIQNYGEYMVTSIKHEAGERSEYFNTFEAIPSGIAVPEEPNVALPKAENQIATVISNEDPKGIGRVEVRFDWQINAMKTAWLRVMTPDAGSSKNHSKNRGHVFIPEIDDQVMVGFEYNDPNRPFVMGGMFHGDNGAGGSANNNIKSIITKSGNEIIFNDGDGKGSIKVNAPKGNSVHLNGDGSIAVFDASGNKMYMDNNGNIDVTAPNHITFNSKKVTFNVADKMQLNVLQKMFINTPFLQQFISTFYHTQAGKALFTSENEIKIESPELYAVGQKKLYLHSDELATLNSKGILETKGEQGNKASNKADDHEIVLPKLSAKCLVNFRPHNNYKGEFGFDWMRMGDTSKPGDEWYKNIIGEYPYKKNAAGNFVLNTDGKKIRVFEQKDSKYISLGRKFEKLQHPTKPKDIYLIPVLTLLPNKTAKFSLKVEIEEEPKELKFKYDTNLFTVSPADISFKTKGKKTLPDYLTITCDAEFDTKKYIEVLADGEFAGKIKVLANDKPHRYKAKIVLVNVEIALLGAGSENPANPTGRQKEFTKYFGQALAKASYVTEDLDLTLDTVFNANFSLGGKIPKAKAKSDAIQDHLIAALKDQYPTKDYSKHYKVFFINEAIVGNLYGRAYGIPSTLRSVVVYQKGFADSTIAHETLHAMGLNHTFSNNSQFTFEKFKTDNIMDYSDIGPAKIPVISSCQWQWDKLWGNLDKE